MIYLWIEIVAKLLISNAFEYLSTLNELQKICNEQDEANFTLTAYLCLLGRDWINSYDKFWKYVVS